MEEMSSNSNSIVTDLTITKLFDQIFSFIKEHDPNHIYKFNYKKIPILIDLLEKEIVSFDENENVENFDDDVNRCVNISNWSYPNFDKLFFYDQYYKIISSAWNYVIIKINEQLFAKVERDRIYEWDDLK